MLKIMLKAVLQISYKYFLTCWNRSYYEKITYIKIKKMKAQKNVQYHNNIKVTKNIILCNIKIINGML